MKKREVETEEKLSMTRELKFKDLQDKIDEEEADRIVEEAIQKSKIKNKKKNVTLELEKEIDELLEVETKKGRKRKKVEIKNVEEELDELLEDKKEEKSVGQEEEKKQEEVKIKKVNIEDDLYLTSSFKPLKKRLKVSKVFKFLFKLIFTLGLLGAFIYFILIPLYKMVESSRPKAIFNYALDYVQDQAYLLIDNTLEVDEKKSSVEVIFDFDTNIKDMEPLMDNKFIFTMGVDAEKDLFENGYYVENDKNVRHGMVYYEDKEHVYTKYTTSDNYLNQGYSYDVEDEEETDYVIVTNDDYKYYVNKIVETIKKAINEDDITTVREELNIDGFSVDVVRNSLVLNDTKLLNYYNKISHALAKDIRFVEITAALNETTVKEAKEYILEEPEIEDNYVLSINIYTTKGNKFVGIDFEENGFRNYYLYKYDNKFIVHLNVSDDEECLTGGTCVESSRRVIDLVGTTKGNNTKVDILLNDEDIGSLEVQEFSYEKIDLNYSLVVQDIRYEGDLLLSFDSKKKEYEFGFSLEFNDEYASINIKAIYDSMKNIGYIDETKVLEYSDKLSEEETEEFYDVMDKEGLTDSFDLFVELLDMFDTLSLEEVEEDVTV